jgi:hypothetical protein
MTNEEKAKVYDSCIWESDKLQRENSKIKSEYPISIPKDQQLIIDKNNASIALLFKRLESLYH